jgi:rubrerythrin
MTDLIAAIDARNGYQEAVKEAEGRALTPLFRELAGLHERHAAQLSGLLAERGQTPNQDEGPGVLR